MLTIAVGLLILDGCAAAWLLASAGRRRRRRAESMRRLELSPAAADRKVAADAMNADLVRRQAAVRAEWAARVADRAPRPAVRPSVERSAAPLPRPSRSLRARPVSGPAQQLLEAADGLAAVGILIYDPAIWERRH